MKKKLFVLAAILVSSAALFTGCKSHRPMRAALALDYLNEVLDLSDEQEQQLARIKDEIQAKVEDIHEDKKEVHNVLKQQLSAEVVDKEVIRQLISERRAKMDQVIDLAVDRLSSFHAGLSQDQRNKLVAKLEKFEQLHRDQ